jgi:hypothetical protein
MSWSFVIPAVQPVAILTPCIGICELAADGYCDGCQRSGNEIGRWTSMDDNERRVLMDEILPARELRRSSLPSSS